MDKYKVYESIGSGTYGNVYRCERLEDSRIVAIKVVSLEGLSKHQKEYALNEVKVMSRLKHSFVVCHLESFIQGGKLHIVMEYVDGGDISQAIKLQRGKYFEEEQIWTWIIQLCQGMKVLHDQRILHRDLKGQNVFLDVKKNIKIGDLGLGRIMSDETVYVKTGCGTPLYFSPELCEEKPYDQKSDIWAMGCMFYEICSLRPPFIASNHMALAQKIMRDTPRSLPKHFTTEMQFLIIKMLEKDPAKRPDIPQILNYSAIKIRVERGKLRAKEKKLEQEQKEKEKELLDKLKEKEAEIAAIDEKAAMVSPLLAENRQIKEELEEWKRKTEETEGKIEEVTEAGEIEKKRLEDDIMKVKVEKERMKNIARHELRRRKEIELKNKELEKKLALLEAQVSPKAAKVPTEGQLEIQVNTPKSGEDEKKKPVRQRTPRRYSPGGKPISRDGTPVANKKEQ